MKSEKMVADTGMRGWDAKPFAERDPNETCFTCRYAAKIRMGPGDIMGQVVCKFGPKHLTSLPQPQGIMGLSGSPAVRPDEWCYQWAQGTDRTDAANDGETAPIIVS